MVPEASRPRRLQSYAAPSLNRSCWCWVVRGARCGLDLAAWPGGLARQKTTWDLPILWQGSHRSAVSDWQRLRKRSSSGARPLRTSGRGGCNGNSQPAARQASRQREVNAEGEEKSRWQEREWGGAKEARRGEARQQEQGQGAGFDSTIRPSVLSQSVSPFCPPVPSPPVSLSVSWSACRSQPEIA